MSVAAIVLVSAEWFLSLADPPQEWPDSCRSGRRSLADCGPWAVVGDAIEAEAGSIAEDEARDTGMGRGSLHGVDAPCREGHVPPLDIACCLLILLRMIVSEITLPPWCA
jgi:hypothetical protein